MWRGERVPFIDCKRHDPETDPAGKRNPDGGLRRDDGGIHGGDHGYDCGLRVTAGNLFRDQQSGGADR